MKVTNLFLKPRHGDSLKSVATIDHRLDGISGNVACAPFRQVLIAARSVTLECGLRVGDLRENIAVDYPGLYDLPSGSVIQIGEALIRLTFHCEPCAQILKLIDFDTIVHKRGVLGTFLNSGTISVGDKLVVTERKLEPIPYAINERLRWFLKHHDMPAAAVDLIHKIGLPSTCAKAMSRMLRRQSIRRSIAEPRITGDPN